MKDPDLELQVTRLENELGFEACKISEPNNKQNLIDLVVKTSKLDIYLTIFVISGTGKVLIDFEEYELQAGSFVFVSRGQLLKVTEHKNLDAVVFLLTQDFMTELFDGRGILPYSRLFSYHQYSPLIKFSKEEYLPLIERADEIYRQYLGKGVYGYKQVIQLLLKVIMYQLVRQRESRFDDSKEPRSIKLFSQFSRLVLENFKNTKSAYEYARLLKVSYKTLNHVCKANINKTAKAYIEYYTILEIKRTLAYSSQSVQEVAFRFGFEEPTNMVKFFKKHTGKTPTQFRNDGN